MVYATIANPNTSTRVYTAALYQRELSKHKIKVSRYTISGSTHKNGTAATFCVNWFVVESSNIDPPAASPNHINIAPRSALAQTASARSPVQAAAAHRIVNTTN